MWAELRGLVHAELVQTERQFVRDVEVTLEYVGALQSLSLMPHEECRQLLR